VTITIQIGNTDGKLTHTAWVNFVAAVNDAIMKRKLPTHFHGFPPATAPWVNACWVVSVPDFGESGTLFVDPTTGKAYPVEIQELKEELQMIRKAYKQESVAWTEGITEFV